MPAPRIPVETPLVGAGGKISQDWWIFLQQLISGAGNQRSVGTNYAVDPNDATIFCNGSLTLKFPVSAPCAGKIWYVFNQGAGTITFAASSGSVRGTASIGAHRGAIVSTDGTNLMVN
jgi:hypothetical protein